MSTRATIQFSDEYDTFFVYRHCDGYPESVMPDLQSVIERTARSWSGSECGTLVSVFLGLQFRENERLPRYEMTSGWHGDESYQYHVEWDTLNKKWEARISTSIQDEKAPD